MDALTFTPATRTTLLAFLLAAALLTGGCEHISQDDPDAQSALLINPAASGAWQARRDLRAGRLQLMEAGKLGVDAPEIAPNDLRFTNIPRHHLPSGTEPHAAAWAKYARAYNAVVIKDFDKETGR